MKGENKYLFSCGNKINSITEDEVGGKAFNLFRLKNFGFTVPRWIVISSKLFDENIFLFRKDIKKIIDKIDFNSRSSIETASKSITELINKIDFSEHFIKEFENALDINFNNDSYFSVRSSAIGEDSKNNSFAGQMDSYLSISREKLIVAIKKVWVSAFSPRVLSYRFAKNIPSENIATAVIIQEMFNSEISGILFTRELVNNNKQCIIEAGFGLGEGIVSNSIETDIYTIDWHSEIICKQVSNKETRIISDRSNGGGTSTVPVNKKFQSKPALTDSQVKCLRNLGVSIEKHFTTPQDIEWAIDRNGKLTILQTRPITCDYRSETDSYFRIWDNSNIVESYPGITLPLTFSFILKGYETSFRNAAFGLLFSKKVIKKDLNIFKNMIGLLDGRIYYNLLNWYQMLSYLPGFNKHKKAWDQMIGITTKIDFPKTKTSFPNNYLSTIKVIKKLFSVGKNAKVFFAEFDSNYNSFKKINFSEKTEHQLVDIFHSLIDMFMPKWHLTLHNDIFAMKYYEWLKQLCSKWGLEKSPNLFNDLLCGENGIESVKPLRSLINISSIINQKQDYQKLFAFGGNKTIWMKIRKDPKYNELKLIIDQHLQNYGDRGIEELKLEKQTFRDQPELLVEVLKGYVNLKLSNRKMSRTEQKKRKEAEGKVKSILNNPVKQIIFWFILMNTRRAIMNRENMRFARTRLFGIVRQIFNQMSDHLVQKRIIETSSDIYYLTIDEVFGYLEGRSLTQNLKVLIQLRKEEYKKFAACDPAERINTDGIPYLNKMENKRTNNSGVKAVCGIGCSSGIVSGYAKIVTNPHSAMIDAQDILIAKSTDPGWVFLMTRAKGLIVEKGSVLSHSAIIGRELGIPTIVCTPRATNLIPDGTPLTMNGKTGEILWK